MPDGTEILACAADHGARNIRVFGSVVSGEAGTTSDVDVLVEMQPGRNLLDLGFLLVKLSDSATHRVSAQ